MHSDRTTVRSTPALDELAVTAQRRGRNSEAESELKQGGEGTSAEPAVVDWTQSWIRQPRPCPECGATPTPVRLPFTRWHATFRSIAGAAPQYSLAINDHPDPPETMQPATVVTMIVILGIVWGGFAGLLVTALRKESGKEQGE
jgi:hypothetical protein